MKKILVLIVLILLVILAVRRFGGKEGGEENVNLELPAKVNVNLAALNNSGEQGTATLEEVNGQVKVMVNLTGAPADQPQPAHLHPGACAAPDPAPAYQLSAVVNGQSETLLEVSLAQLKGELPLSINVHKSADDAATYVACGDLTIN